MMYTDQTKPLLYTAQYTLYMTSGEVHRLISLQPNSPCLNDVNWPTQAFTVYWTVHTVYDIRKSSQTQIHCALMMYTGPSHHSILNSTHCIWHQEKFTDLYHYSPIHRALMMYTDPSHYYILNNTHCIWHQEKFIDLSHYSPMHSPCLNEVYWITHLLHFHLTYKLYSIHYLGIEFYLFVSHGGMNDRGFTCKFRNARSTFRNLHVDFLSFIPPWETNK